MPISAKLYSALALGQTFQTMFQINLPWHFTKRTFGDLFRFFASRSILVLGLYRAATEENNAILPYVYTSPDLSVVCKVFYFILQHLSPPYHSPLLFSSLLFVTWTFTMRTCKLTLFHPFLSFSFVRFLTRAIDYIAIPPRYFCKKHWMNLLLPLDLHPNLYHPLRMQRTAGTQLLLNQ